MDASLLAAIAAHARQRPSARAISGEHITLSYADVMAEIGCLREGMHGHVIGLLADNGPAWILLDLAIQAVGAVCVPLPDFFSDDQLRHIIAITGMDRIYTDQPARIKAILGEDLSTRVDLARQSISCFGLQPQGRPVTADKITFTSGTTAEPRGVCLDQASMLKVATALAGALSAGPDVSFLSLLPLATLLENISVHATLLAGGSIHLPGTQGSGVGVTCLDMERLCRCISVSRPGMLVLVPQMLKALLGAVDNGWRAPESLHFIAVGGAAVAPTLLQQARDQGLPVYEGYGLSEAGSVVSLNLPGSDRPGSVGKPLPHVRLRIADDGEILVGGVLMQGYLGEGGHTGAFWPTGDLGYLDDDGFLFLEGRKGNRIITSYGRNLSPEWPERELLAQRMIAQAIVLGDARPFNSALIVAMPGATCAQLEQAVDEANLRLPEYARITRWHICTHAFTTGKGELSANGRLRRAVIAAHYRAEIEQLYQEQKYGLL